jgi:NADPH:quinone reductase-like Zn-dependent oxidoreductase
MRALRFHSYGPPDVLRIDELPEPSPGAGQVKVRVQAVGLNPLDWKIRAGEKSGKFATFH